MVSFSFKFTLLSLLAIFANSWMAIARDPDILTDFIVPPNLNGSEITGHFFTYHLNTTGNGGPDARETDVTMDEFPALNGQGVSLAVYTFPPRSAYPTHIHPRASELFLVTKGKVEVGLVDTANKLYKNSLGAGDVFLFPKGLVHYQYNALSRASASAVSFFGSASPGEVSLPTTLFATGIDDGILAKIFKTDVPTIQKLKSGLATPRF